MEKKPTIKNYTVLDYKYIPLQQVLMKSESKVVHLILQKKGENIGYIEGAGDAVPESLEANWIPSYSYQACRNNLR